jgi:hypothetical protein
MKLHPQVVLVLQQGNCRNPQPGQLDELQLHALLEQTRGLVHTCPHDPQLFLSFVSLTHAPLQLV